MQPERSHKVPAGHRINQAGAKQASPRNHKGAVLTMHSRSHRYTHKHTHTPQHTHTTTHTRARKKGENCSFPQPCHAARNQTDGADRDKTPHSRSETAVMVLTRLPLLAGPTDGERFSGRREREW